MFYHQEFPLLLTQKKISKLTATACNIFAISTCLCFKSTFTTENLSSIMRNMKTYEKTSHNEKHFISLLIIIDKCDISVKFVTSFDYWVIELLISTFPFDQLLAMVFSLLRNWMPTHDLFPQSLRKTRRFMQMFRLTFHLKIRNNDYVLVKLKFRIKWIHYTEISFWKRRNR